MTDVKQPASPPKPDFDAAADAKRVLRTIRSGALATLDSATGHPFVSLTNVATDIDGSPLLLLSTLAAHTKHLEADPRCSLLLARTGKGDPLTHARLTLSGTVERTREGSGRSRFLRRHPKAALYADFGDFGFWRMQVARAHHNGGFGRAGAFDGRTVLTDMADAVDLAAVEDAAVDRLNGEAAAFLSVLAQRCAGERPGPWRATGIDPDGLDLMWTNRVARIGFPRRVTSEADFREMFEHL